MPAGPRARWRRFVLRPRFDARALALALGLGLAGGAVAAWLRLPLAWMIGSMLLTTAASLAGLRPQVPPRLRSAMTVVLGVLLGSAFDPAVLPLLGHWLVTLAGLALYIVASAAVGILFLRVAARYDATTAFFTATPGGFNEMVLIGGAMGGDDRTIALGHSIRILVVVLALPFGFQWWLTYDPAARGPLGPSLGALAPLDWLLLAACAVGAPAARLARLPAPMLLGPMLMSAAVHLAGLTTTKPPGIVTAVAQLVIGAAVGSRFAGLGLAFIGRSALTAAALAVLLLGLTVAFAWGLHLVTGLPVIDIMLAYAPGGLAEMSLTALALGADGAFVATHHIARIALIVTLAPLAFALLRRVGRRRGPPAA